MSEYFEFHSSKRYSSSVSDYTEEENHRYNRKHFENDRLKSLNRFKELIQASSNLLLHDKSCCFDDDFLYRFLNARKFSHTDAFNFLLAYLSYKKRNNLLLQNINIFDDNIQLALRDGLPTILSQRDRKGRTVLLFSTANWDTEKYSLEDIFRAFLLSLDTLLENKHNQAQGFVVIVDWSNFTFQKYCKISPKILKLLIEGLQDCFPAKFKGIHFISQPWFVEIIHSIIKPFLHGKIKERFQIHRANMNTLHEAINKQILPPELGGEGPCINTLDWYHALLESSQNTEVYNSYRLVKPQFYCKTSLTK